jgi:hypothetical protein
MPFCYVTLLLVSTLVFGEDKTKDHAQALAGCYEATVKSAAALVHVPKRFMLLNEPIKDEQPWFNVRVLGVKRDDFRYRHSGWKAAGKDSLVVGFNSGTAGSNLKLRRSGDILVGTISASADAGGQEPFHEYEVSIRRIACP